jgi:hypothetical protein
VIKVVYLFKRRASMTPDEFRDYYENTHLRLFDSILNGPDIGNYISRHVRRYLTPISDRMSGTTRPGFDGILEIWFKTKEAYEAYCKGPIEPQFRKAVTDDEERFLDREHTQCYVVDECDLDIPATPGDLTAAVS